MERWRDGWRDGWREELRGTSDREDDRGLTAVTASNE